jgi:hypothetical protein
MRVIKKVAGKNFPRNHQSEKQNQPRKKLANPGTDFVNEEQQVLH